MDNRKLVVIPIKWFVLYFLKYDEDVIFIFHIKTRMQILEYDHMYEDKKKIFLYFCYDNIFDGVHSYL